MTKVKSKAPDIKQLIGSTVLIAAEQSSTVILSPNSQGGLKDVQTVIRVGPHIRPDNGYNIVPGDKVLLNLEGLFKTGIDGRTKQVAAIGQELVFDNETGEFVGYKYDKNKNQTLYFLIDARRILLVFPE